MDLVILIKLDMTLLFRCRMSRSYSAASCHSRSRSSIAVNTITSIGYSLWIITYKLYYFTQLSCSTVRVLELNSLSD